MTQPYFLAPFALIPHTHIALADRHVRVFHVSQLL